MERAHSVFEKLDVNSDGLLNEQEFVDGCLTDQRIASLLNTGSTHQTLEEEQEEKDADKES